MEKVIISKHRFAELLKKELKLDCLEAGGVSNYEFYDECINFEDWLMLHEKNDDEICNSLGYEYELVK